MSNASTGGTIEYTDGWRFKWLLQGDRVPEVWGAVEAPNGSLVKGSSGFYRTHLPFMAAKSALGHIGGRTYY